MRFYFMYKIVLLPTSEGRSIEIESEIIFDNETQLYLYDMETIIITNRSYTINNNNKGIECITYFYEFV